MTAIPRFDDTLPAIFLPDNPLPDIPVPHVLLPVA